MRKVTYDLTTGSIIGLNIIDCTKTDYFPNLEDIGIVQDFETVGSA